MDSAGTSDTIVLLARAADTVAGRPLRAWRIGHELAKDLTADGRSMTAPEVALVQALERSLDWSDEGQGQFRPWWLDEDTSLGETDEEWPAVWAAVADAAEHPIIVAHLSDLLWVARHGTPHLHARRAIDAYLESSALFDEPHDRSRSLVRAHQLAGSLGDRERLGATEAHLCQAVDTAVSDGDLDVAVALLDHLISGRRLTNDGDSATAQLLNRAWDAVARPDQVETLAKLLLRRTEDRAEREMIAARVVEAFRTMAEQAEGFRRLVTLREALRVAEELGHPAHDEILHEIETLDTESAFSPIRTETVVSRDVVSDFCAQVVGDDSLENALARFAFQLPITPTAIERVRESTEIGIRHAITNIRIGEANSIVTSTEGTHSDEDPLVAALERDVLQRVGYQAQMTAFLMLVPALHQVLDSYHPWTVADVRVLLEAGLADVVVADALARGLEHYRNRRYDEAVHVALPRVERLIRHIARQCGVATTKRPTKRVGGVRGLGEILVDLRGDGDKPILFEPFLTAAELTLVEPDSLNLRNDFLHGISDEARARDAALILQLGLALALGIQVGPGDSAR